VSFYDFVVFILWKFYNGLLSCSNRTLMRTGLNFYLLSLYTEYLNYQYMSGPNHIPKAYNASHILWLNIWHM
jgi:hypothetical protein